MPFLTRDLPPGGRHVDRTVPPAVPLAPAAARVRQLLPVGLLLAASSAGVALSPLVAGGTSAVADAGHESPVRLSGTIPNADYVPGAATQVDRAAYVVSRDDDRRPGARGRHRATGAFEQAVAVSGTGVAPVVASTGGKHRASGTATTTAPATQQAAPKHSSATPAPATKQATVTQTAATATQPAASSAPATSIPTAAPQQTDVLTSTVSGVGQVVGGVLGTVSTLLGGN